MSVPSVRLACEMILTCLMRASQLIQRTRIKLLMGHPAGHGKASLSDFNPSEAGKPPEQVLHCRTCSPQGGCCTTRPRHFRLTTKIQRTAARETSYAGQKCWDRASNPYQKESGHAHPVEHIKPRCRQAGGRTIALNVAKGSTDCSPRGDITARRACGNVSLGKCAKKCITCSGLASEDPKRIRGLVGAAPADTDELGEACF